MAILSIREQLAIAPFVAIALAAMLALAIVSPSAAWADENAPMHRLYNPNSGEHFYTADESERDGLVSVGWRYEGVAWEAPLESDIPVYRLYSGTDHHYTVSADERDGLIDVGWSYEGVGWYSYDASGTPLLRQYNPNVNPSASFNNSGSHNYTSSLDENAALVEIGWSGEGLAWFGAPRDGVQLPYVYDAPSRDALLMLAWAYCPEAAYVLQADVGYGENVLQYYSAGDAVLDSFETTCHEMVHAYDYNDVEWWSGWKRYYVGYADTRYVPTTNVFLSREMASSIPASLRTSRYDTYVNTDDGVLDSNKSGAYGLLEEFCAYRTGMSASLRTFGYRSLFPPTDRIWHDYVAEFGSGRLAFAEFDYYILHYLLYAREHHPDVYGQIVGNRGFCSTFLHAENGFLSVIAEYESALQEMKGFLEPYGIQVDIDDDNIWFSVEDAGSRSGIGTQLDDFEKLRAEVSSQPYREIHAAIEAGAL